MGRRRVVKFCTGNIIDGGKPKTGAQILGIDASPVLIPKLTFELIIQKLLCTPPVDRNIFVTMNVYNLHEINPTLKYVPNSPTSIIIFCIRLLRSEKFQPIGALQTYDDTDQSVTIAQCLKVFINDLALLGLNVVATVSPPNTVFKAVLKHLVQSTTLFDQTYSKIITYSAGPFKEIIHIYDMNVLISQFESLFEQRKDVKYTFNNKEDVASWTDIYLIHTAINSQYGSNRDLPDNYKSDVSIFSPEFQMHFNKCRCLGILTPANESTQTLLILINSITSLFDNFDLEVEDLRYNCYHWDKLKTAIASLSFKKIHPQNINRHTDTKTDGEFSEEKNFEIEAARIASIIEFLNNQDVKPKEVKKNERNKPVIIRNNLLNGIKKTDKNSEVDNYTSNNNNNTSINDMDLESEITTKPIVVSEVKKETQTTRDGDNGDKENILNNYQINRPKSTRANILLDYLHSNDYKTKTKTDSDSDNNINKTPKKTTKTYDYFNKQNKTVTEKVKPLLTDCDIAQKIIETENNNIDLYLSGSPVNLTDGSCSEFDFEVQDMDEFIEKHFVHAKTKMDEKTLKRLLFKTKFKPETCKYNCDIKTKYKNGNFKDKKYTATNEVKDQNGNVKDTNIMAKDEDNKTAITKLLGCEGNYLKFRPLSELKETKNADEINHNLELESSSIDCDTSTDIPKSDGDDKKSSSFTTTIPERFEKKQLTADWLSTIYGVQKLSERLADRRVKKISPHVLTSEHADYFVTLIKKAKNMLKCVLYVGRVYTFLDYETAFRTLESDVGLYLIRK